MVDIPIRKGRPRRPASTLSGSDLYSAEHLAAFVAREMPGWQIDHNPETEAPSAEDSSMKSETGPTIAALRRKFLGEADAAADVSDLIGVDEKVRTVRIKPKDGGPAKVADIRNGKISIVQG